MSNRRSPLYDLHVYPSKKPHQALAALIEHFSRPGETVLDPMCGSGGVAFVARSLHRRAVAFDLSPLACWLTAHLAEPADADALLSGFEAVSGKLQAKLAELYRTTCTNCGQPALVKYRVHSAWSICANCGQRILWSLTGEAHNCPKCGARLPRPVEVGNTEPVEVYYECLAGCKPRLQHKVRFDESVSECAEFADELEQWRGVQKLPAGGWLPNPLFPQGKETRRLFRAGMPHISDLFTPRNWYALGLIKQAISARPESQRRPLELAFSAALLGCTRMCTLSNGNSLRGTYYVPPIQRENNVWNLFTRKVKSVAKGLKLAGEAVNGAPELIIERVDATDLSRLADNSVDYVLTDPPYAGNVQYSELNFFWEALLELGGPWQQDEVVVNRFQHKGLPEWTVALGRVLSEIHRVLKPDHYASVCFQNGQWAALWALQEAVRASGLHFAAQRATTVLVGQKSYNQINTRQVNKRDLVFHLVKSTEPVPSADPASAAEVRRLVEKARARLDSSRVWDEVTGSLLQQGRLPAEDMTQLVLDAG